MIRQQSADVVLVWRLRCDRIIFIAYYILPEIHVYHVNKVLWEYSFIVLDGWKPEGVCMVCRNATFFHFTQLL